MAKNEDKKNLPQGEQKMDYKPINVTLVLTAEEHKALVEVVMPGMKNKNKRWIFKTLLLNKIEELEAKELAKKELEMKISEFESEKNTAA